MAFIGNDSTDFAGLEQRLSRPGTFIKCEDLGGESLSDGILTDQASLFQYVTGLQLDNSTDLTDAQTQVHDGTDGCLLGWPISSVRPMHCADYSANGIGADSIPATATIISSGVLDRVIYRWPVYIPTGTSTMWAVFNCDDSFISLNPKFVIYNTSFVEQARYFIHSDEGHSPAWGSMKKVRITAPSSGAVYIFSLEISVDESNTRTPCIRGIDILPDAYRKVESNEAPPQSPYEITEYGQPSTAANLFLGIHEEFTAANRPLTSYVVFRAAANDALLHELVTGAKAKGASGSSNWGHDHRGTDLYGKQIEIVLFSRGLGTLNSPLSDADGTDGALQCPYIVDSSNTWCIGSNAIIRTPKYEGTLTANWCAVTYSNFDTDSTDVFMAVASNWATYTVFSSTSSSAAETGWHYHTGTLELTADALQHIKASFRYETTESGIKVYFAGFAMWIEAP